jgi:hypothetical protein
MEMVSRDGPLQGRYAAPHVNDLKKKYLTFCFFFALSLVFSFDVFLCYDTIYL